MLLKVFKIKCLTVQQCFCFLTPKMMKTLNDKYVSIKYEYKGNIRDVFFSGSTSPVAIADNEIGINVLLAKKLNLFEGQEVLTTVLSELPLINQVSIYPENIEDYEILVVLADTIQSTLLHQIRVLNNNQQFIVWIGKGVKIGARPFDIKPTSPGYIGELTEVTIMQPDQCNSLNSVIDEKNIQAEQCSNFWDNENRQLIFRINQLNTLPLIDQSFSYVFTVFAFRKRFPVSLRVNTKDNDALYTLNIHGSHDKENVVVRLYFLEDFYSNDELSLILHKDNIFVSPEILEHFQLIGGDRITLNQFQGTLPFINEIQICVQRSFLSMANSMWKKFVTKCFNQTMVLNNNIVFALNEHAACYTTFPSSEAKFYTTNIPTLLQNSKVSFTDGVVQRRQTDTQIDDDLKFFGIKKYECKIDDCLLKIKHWCENGIPMENILIEGGRGMGKSSFLKVVKKKANAYPFFIYTKFVDFMTLKGKTVQTLDKLITSIFFELSHRQPSILLVDNIDALCLNVREIDISSQQDIYNNSVSQLMESVITSFCSSNDVRLIATTKSIMHINSYIYNSRGKSVFKNVYILPTIEKDDREVIFNNIFTTTKFSDIDFGALISKTDGFALQDLLNFCRKAVYESYLDGDSVLTQEHCIRALNDTSVPSLTEFTVNQNLTKQFSDIGGMETVKKIIVETMQWCAHYPKLFSAPPIRLPTGLLLYGAPGSGKTLIAGAAANFCGIRLLVIKGPELLSKYIGASEQAVRDIFQKASNAKPCIMFFDEFDSLAPRRGHDNTGVTDRVVNQLLTQLDGVEPLSGVWLLAATSRPDLLDPALLRPGRLDNKVYCPLPDKNERFKILQVLSKNLHLGNDVDLHLIAENTEGFSGADLKSILYTAEIKSIKRKQTNNQNDSESDRVKNFITQEELLTALNHTKPSLSKEERIKFETIYNNFQNGAKKSFKPDSKITLA